MLFWAERPPEAGWAPHTWLLEKFSGPRTRKAFSGYAPGQEEQLATRSGYTIGLLFGFGLFSEAPPDR